MRERFQLDIYNVLIVALVPAMLLAAWGLTTAYERNQRAQQCEEAVTYLQEATDNASLYTEADSIDDADTWLDNMQELSPPEPASDLHNGALSAFTYATTMNVEADMTAPGGLYSELTSFREVIDEGRETLVSQCPDTEQMINDAFPMYFRNEGQE